MSAIPPVILKYVDGLKRHDVAAIAETVSDELAFVTPLRRLTRTQFLEMLQAIYTAFPDWLYRHEPPELQEQVVSIRWEQSGTHTGTFSLPGMPPMAATGTFVRIPSQQFVYTVRNDRIVEIRPEAIPGGAPGGILEQIGAPRISL